MRAYVHDGLPGPSIAAHDSGRAVSEDTLAALGLIARPSVDLAEVDAIAAQRGYKCRDEISVSKAGLGDAVRPLALLSRRPPAHSPAV